MSFLIFMLVLSVLVIIHEAGHFLTAKKAGIKVEEFGIGYPPRAATLFTDKQGTEYTLNWLPFGGFVRLLGEDGGEEVEKKKPEGAFFTKQVWQRMLVVLAGAMVNFVFGVLAFGTIYTIVGVPTEFDYVRIEEVAEGSPAQEVGLEAGDEVTAVVVDGERRGTESVEEFVDLVKNYQGKTVDLVLRDKTVGVYVRTEAEIPVGEGALGVVVTDYGLMRYPVYEMPFRGMWYGLKSAIQFGGMLLGVLGQMARDAVTLGKLPEDVAGPVGIVHAVSREGILEEGFLAIINFAAILSINLAIVNVLPFPALDGGRALFLILEGMSGKRMRPKLERWLNTAGFLLLIGLIIVISIRDVGRVLEDEAVREFLKRYF